MMKRNKLVIKQSTIAIIGAGSVGTTTAYALILNNINAEIILIDIDETRCIGEVLDLSDALAFNQMNSVRKGSLQEAARADIIIITAGQKQKPGQGRTELLETNKKVIAQIFKSINPIEHNAIVIMVSNPVDILTYHAQQLSGLPHNQLFGSGTYLDTQRLRSLIAQQLNISRQIIELYVVGEHGDSQVPLWSTALIDNIPLMQSPYIKKINLEQIAEQGREQAYKIIECKGSTYYGIATCIAQLCNIILSDQKQIVPISCYSKHYDIYFSLPVVLGKTGIEKIMPTKPNKDEQSKLEKSATIIKELIRQIQ